MNHRQMMLLVAILVLGGCNSSDERLSRLVRETTADQATQNRSITELSREAADNHRRVVEVVEQSRQEFVLLERDMKTQRDRIDEERRALADERRRESILGPVLSGFGMLLVAALPLVLSWYLLHGMRSPQDDVSEVLIQSLAGAQFVLPTPTSARHAIDQVSSTELTKEPPF